MKARLTKTIGKKRINATVSLDDDCKNGVCSWSVTGEYSEQLKNDRWVNISCGAIHDTILKHFPELSDFVALHLSNIHGQPMYPVENGHYWLTRNGVEGAAEYLRIPVEIARLLSGDKDLFKYQLKQLGIVDHWEEESRKAIEHLEQITGKKFVNPYNENDEKFVLRYTQEELDDMAKKIDSGYYSKEQIEARDRKKREAKHYADRKRIVNRFDKEIRKSETEKQVYLYVFDMLGTIENIIYYYHSNTLTFNWSNMSLERKWTREEFDEFSNNVGREFLPDGIKLEFKEPK